MPTDQTDTVDTVIATTRVLIGMAIRSINTVDDTITVAQHRVLVLLGAGGPQTITDIAAELGVNPSNATRHCDRLHRMGLVAKQRSRSDRRLVEVTLTRAGKDLLDAVTEARRTEVLAALKHLDAAQQDAAVRALAAFNDAAREALGEHVGPARSSIAW